MSCSICLEVVKEKADITERQFGILENCNHSFCLACIRKWRISSHVEKKVVRACPICRVTSWFVTPSDTWVDEKEEKKQLIESYKKHLKTKHCRNFNRGKGSCRFGAKCFYKHAYPDGSEQKVGDKPNRAFSLPDLLDDSESDDDEDGVGNIGQLLRDLRALLHDSDLSSNSHHLDSDSDSDSDDSLDTFDVSVSGDSNEMLIFINGDLFVV